MQTQTQPQQTLTGQEQAIVIFIHGYLAQNQISPSISEIAEAIGLTLYPTHRWLLSLRNKGWLRWTPHSNRSFKLWFQFQQQEEHEQENLA